MKPIRIPNYNYRELRQLFRCREKYVDLHKVSRQRIKPLPLFTHLHIPLKRYDPVLVLCAY